MIHGFSSEFVISLHLSLFSYIIVIRQDYRYDMLSYEYISIDTLLNLFLIYDIITIFSNEFLVSVVNCPRHFQIFINTSVNYKIHKQDLIASSSFSFSHQ